MQHSLSKTNRELFEKLRSEAGSDPSVLEKLKQYEAINQKEKVLASQSVRELRVSWFNYVRPVAKPQCFGLPVQHTSGIADSLATLSPRLLCRVRILFTDI